MREVDKAIGAYNALLATPHWFEMYVPRNLVRRLMEQEDGELAPAERARSPYRSRPSSRADLSS